MHISKTDMIMVCIAIFGLAFVSALRLVDHYPPKHFLEKHCERIDEDL